MRDIGVARVPRPRDKNIFAPPPTKTAAFELKAAQKRGRSKTFAVYYLRYFSK